MFKHSRGGLGRGKGRREEGRGGALGEGERGKAEKISSWH